MIGIKIWNDDGTVHIDDTYYNLVLKTKLTLPMVFNGPMDNTFWRAYFYCQRASVKLSDYPNCVFAVKHVNESDKSIPLGYFFKDGFLHVEAITYNTGMSVEVYVFNYDKSAVNQTNDDYGIVIYDAQGNPTFDSRQKYLRIMRNMFAVFEGKALPGGHLEDPWIPKHLGDFDISGLAGLQLAYFIPSPLCLKEFSYWDDGELDWGEDKITTFTTISISGNNASVDYSISDRRTTQHRNGSPGPGTRYYYEPNFSSCVMLVDVTNY